MHNRSSVFLSLISLFYQLYSMGGKAAAATALVGTWNKIESVVILDISPVPYTREDIGSVFDTVDFLVNSKDKIAKATTKQEVVDIVNDEFDDPSLRAFLLSNLQSSAKIDGGFEWKFSLEGIEPSIDRLPISHFVIVNSVIQVQY